MAGDRDVNDYIDVMRQQVKGEWTVHHQLGHDVEKRKKYRWKDPWTMAEWGNWVAYGIDCWTREEDGGEGGERVGGVG
jgi:hypothetical protein